MFLLFIHCLRRVRAEMKYIHDFDLMFSVTSEHEDPDEIDPTVLLEACSKRLFSLRREEVRDAFEHVSTVEEED